MVEFVVVKINVDFNVDWRRASSHARYYWTAAGVLVRSDIKYKHRILE